MTVRVSAENARTIYGERLERVRKAFEGAPTASDATVATQIGLRREMVRDCRRYLEQQGVLAARTTIIGQDGRRHSNEEAPKNRKDQVLDRIRRAEEKRAEALSDAVPANRLRSRNRLRPEQGLIAVLHALAAVTMTLEQVHVEQLRADERVLAWCQQLQKGERVIGRFRRSLKEGI